MNREQLYNIYQTNLELLENELVQVKRMAQANLGKLCYAKLEEKELGEIQKREKDVLGITRLYTFLLCSWLEARIKKILYEGSSVAFTEAERNQILSARKMSCKWKKYFNMAVCKSYGFIFKSNKNNYTDCFGNRKEELYCYQKVLKYLDDIKQAITVRNRLAHGQWETQLNYEETRMAGPEVYDFLNQYDNVQKLDMLYSIYKIIAEIISSYVVYKDKNVTNNFNDTMIKKIKEIENFHQRIEKSNFEKYCKPFMIKEKSEYKNRKKVYIKE